MERENEFEVEDLTVTFYARNGGEVQPFQRDFESRVLSCRPLSGDRIQHAEPLLRTFMRGWKTEGWTMLDGLIIRYEDFIGAEVTTTKRIIKL